MFINITTVLWSLNLIWSVDQDRCALSCCFSFSLWKRRCWCFLPLRSSSQAHKGLCCNNTVVRKITGICMQRFTHRTVFMTCQYALAVTFKVNTHVEITIEQRERGKEGEGERGERGRRGERGESGGQHNSNPALMVSSKASSLDFPPKRCGFCRNLVCRTGLLPPLYLLL